MSGSFSRLNKSLRGQLEKTVSQARQIAEKGARGALEQLGVNQKLRPDWLCEKDNELRKVLRAHGRQLGDPLNGGNAQAMDRLVEETAYEHWHRMLFARFLAENGLLMYADLNDPDNPVPVSLSECMELATDPGVANAWNVKNGWQLAAKVAARQLPQIFIVDSPVFHLGFAPEYQQKLEKLLADLPPTVFNAADSLGWVYQFWQSEAKDLVNKAEVKIGAIELPAVTQLFTEAYMVDFLLDNSLGAWLAARKLTDADLQNAQTEDELRQKAAIPGASLPYLRFVKTASGWRIAAGSFPDWTDSLTDFRLLDPCCGSGHFLVSALRMLAAMRSDSESLSPKEAVTKVLEQNLFGLELDSRCVKLAAFALAFAAWTWTPPGCDSPLGFFQLPKLNIACSGTAVTADREKWIAIAPPNSRLRNALALLHEEFINAPTLGSLIEPESSEVRPEPEELRDALAKALASENSDADDLRETAVAAAGIALATKILSHKFSLIATNVPYLARGKQAEGLKNFCEAKYPLSRQDIATVFLQRCLKLCVKGGCCALVMPQNWLFLGAYKKLREELLRHDSWNLLARLGPGAFETISGEVVKAILIILSNLQPIRDTPLLGEKALPHLMAGIDVSALPNAAAKARGLIEAEVMETEQARQLENPDFTIILGHQDSNNLLNNYSTCLAGIMNGDSAHFERQFWEFRTRPERFVFEQSSVTKIIHFGGMEKLIEFDDVNGHMFLPAEHRRIKLHNADERGNSIWGRRGIAISEMRSLPVSLYVGNKYDTNIGVLTTNNEAYLPAIWCFCSSPEYNTAIRSINQKLNVTNSSLVKVPFDLERWQKVAAEQYPNGLPKPYSNDPTQWIFHGHPAKSVIWSEEAKSTTSGPLRYDANVLQIAVARLLGYRWPAENDPDMELAEEQRELARECAIFDQFADKDGIVCIPAIGGEQPADSRLLDLLAAAYSPGWSNAVLNRLLKAAGFGGKTLESFLRDGFFAQHCRLFQNRPFIWQVWDGLSDGFSALLNYHRLDYKNLENLVYTYLGDWIKRQNQDKQAGVSGAGEKLAAAQNLQNCLKDILKGEKPLDIFVRWKTLTEQSIGWNPDTNDGVRLNIRPFMSCPDIGKKKGAGILRDKPNIKWDKDRGKDLENAPWYGQFHGERINDWHLTLDDKKEGGAHND